MPVFVPVKKYFFVEKYLDKFWSPQNYKFAGSYNTAPDPGAVANRLSLALPFLAGTLS